MDSLILAPTTCRVSSVLDRNKTLYGGDNMLNDDVITCWNSAQGSPQQILLQFHRAVSITTMQCMFQGGFVGQDAVCFVKKANSEGSKWEQVCDFQPEDSNELQSFDCPAKDVDALRIVFGRSTDFYGRVIIYRLNVLGQDDNA